MDGFTQLANFAGALIAVSLLIYFSRYAEELLGEYFRDLGMLTIFPIGETQNPYLADGWVRGHYIRTSATDEHESSDIHLVEIPFQVSDPFYLKNPDKWVLRKIVREFKTYNLEVIGVTLNLPTRDRQMQYLPENWA